MCGDCPYFMWWGDMLLKACSRCGVMIPYGARYCTECKPKAEAEAEEYKRIANSKYNRKRDPKYTQFYNSKDWRTLSRVYAQAKGWRCEQCGEIASEVHHKRPIQVDWSKRLDYNNLELLCTRCHNERHGRFTKRDSQTDRQRYS